MQEYFFESIKPKIVTKFYSKLLSVWYDFIKIDIKTVSELLSLKLFNDPINNKPIPPESDDWTKSGFENVAYFLMKPECLLKLNRKYNIVGTLFYL